MRQIAFIEVSFGHRNKFAITPEIDHLLDAIGAVDREDSQDGEIEEKDYPIEGVQFVKWTDVSPGLVYQIMKIAFEEHLRLGT